MSLYEKFSFTIEMLVILLAFTKHFEKRKYFIVSTVLSSILIIGVSCAWDILKLPSLSISKFLVLISLIYLILSLGCKEKWDEKLFALTAAYSVQTILYSLYATTVYGLRKYISVNAVLNCGIYLLVFGLGIYICYKYFSLKMLDKQNINIDNRIVLALAIAVVLISNFFNIIALKVVLESDFFHFVFQPMRIIPCFMILFLQFNLLSNAALKTERNMLEALLKSKDTQYQISKENIELIQMKCHDLKYQMKALRENYSLKQDAISEIEKSIDIYDSNVKTGNDALDIILTEKSLYCENHNIKVTVMLDGQKLKNINVTDLYSIFGNALDNAIEAVDKIEDEEKRLISITSNSLGNLVSIRIANYCAMPIILENGLPKTSKDDNGYHGFGLKSIAYILEKYDGNLSVFQEDNQFILNMVLPI